MRLTRRRLRLWAEQYVAEKRRDLNLLAVYLTGSLLDEEPLFGGTTDIDIVCVYNLTPERQAEVRPLPGGVHLDIRHWARERLEPPRKLRHDPWLGHEVYYAQPLYDPQHFLDFVQSGARSRFHQPEVAAARAWVLLERGRDAWARLGTAADPLAPAQVRAYVDAVYAAMHIPATLHGRVLPWRRAAWLWRDEAAKAGHPEWVAAWLRALAAPGLDAAALGAALEPWDAAWQVAHTVDPVAFHPARAHYYRAGIAALLEREPATQALLLLLRTWSQALEAAAPARPEVLSPWTETLTAWGWADAQPRLDALDQWLDSLEAFLEAWAQARGVSL